MAATEQNRREFLQTLGIGTAALSAAAGQAQEPGPRRPNILLYVVDDLGTGDAGCYGHPVIQTPGLDRLAREGTRFTNAYATTASCSPSRSVILTGLNNHANGMYGLAHSYHHFESMPDVRSLPAMLADVGYRTCCAGKYHVAPEEVYPFDTMLGGGPPEALAEKCRPIISGDPDQPFFLYFCTTEPHRPFRRDGFDHYTPEEVVVPPYLPDTPECREELAQYYGSAERADSGLLRLIALLEETGHWEDTVVVFVSDNGIAFPGAKTTAYEPGLRLPCVVRSPDQNKRGGVCQGLVSWVDLTPTLLEFAGVTPEEASFHGRSFRGILEEDAPEGWEEVYGSHTFHEVTMYYPMRVVRSGQWKCIWNIAHELQFPFAQDLQQSKTWQAALARGDDWWGVRSIEDYLYRPEFELFDLEADPWEAKNLAEEPEHTEKLAEMKQKLRTFQEATKDPWLHKWEYE